MLFVTLSCGQVWRLAGQAWWRGERVSGHALSIGTWHAPRAPGQRAHEKECLYCTKPAWACPLLSCVPVFTCGPWSLVESLGTRGPHACHATRPVHPPHSGSARELTRTGARRLQSQATCCGARRRLELYQMSPMTSQPLCRLGSTWAAADHWPARPDTHRFARGTSRGDLIHTSVTSTRLSTSQGG